MKYPLIEVALFKTNRVLTCLVSLFAVSALASDLSLPAMDQSLQDLAFLPTGELHIVGVNKDNDPQLRWLTWGERSAQGSVARLAVVGKRDGVSRFLSIQERPDAYAPSIRPLPWNYANKQVLAWVYHYGAAVQVLELYGLNEQSQLVKLDELSAMSIEWGADRQGKMQLRAYDQGNRAPKPSCYHWLEKQHKLRASSCY